jgi:hypothetical protein
MSDKPISFIDDLDLDQGPEPEAADAPKHGLVVGPRLTEKEFEAIHGGDRRKLPPDEIIFEDEHGNVMVTGRGQGTDE